MTQMALYLLFPLCMLHAAASDLRSLTIPNRVPVVLVLLFAVLAPLFGLSLPVILWHLAGAAAVFVVVLVLFAHGFMGGGDAKLIAATALWMGAGVALAEYVAAFALAGGLFALVVLALRHSPLAGRIGRMPWLGGLADTAHGLPYGVALAVGGLIAYPSCELARQLWP